MGEIYIKEFDKRFEVVDDEIQPITCGRGKDLKILKHLRIITLKEPLSEPLKGGYGILNVLSTGGNKHFECGVKAKFYIGSDDYTKLIEV